MFKIVEAQARTNYRLFLRFADGAAGEVDLSHLAGKGVFSSWTDESLFAQVAIGKSGEVYWPGDIDLCPDSLYLTITGKSPEAVFPNLKVGVHA